MTGDLLIYPTIAVILAVGAYCLWKRVNGSRTFLILCFVLYASMVAEVTLFPIPVSLAEIAQLRGDPAAYVAPDLNLVPFASIVATARGPEALGAGVFVRNWLGNLLLLLPLGVLAPLIWERYRDVWRATLLFVAVSLSIEFAQYVGAFLIFRIRWKSADVDDLIVNVAGALIGFLLAQAFLSVKRVMGGSAPPEMPAPRAFQAWPDRPWTRRPSGEEDSHPRT